MFKLLVFCICFWEMTILFAVLGEGCIAHDTILGMIVGFIIGAVAFLVIEIIEKKLKEKRTK